MWKPASRASDTPRAFTISVQGAYQPLGPQGTITRVGRPSALRVVTRSTSSCAMSRPISRPSATIRNGTRRAGWPTS